MKSYKQLELNNCIITRLWDNENTKHATLDNLTLFVKDKKDGLIYAICTNEYFSVFSQTDGSKHLYKFDKSGIRKDINILSSDFLQVIDERFNY